MKVESFWVLEGHREMAPLSLWLGDRQSEKMATVQQKAFCVLQFARCDSVVTVQREFRWRYGFEPPGAQSIRGWYRGSEERDVRVKARAQDDRTCLRIMCKESECVCSAARRVNQPRQSRTGNSSDEFLACFETTLDYEAIQDQSLWIILYN